MEVSEPEPATARRKNFRKSIHVKMMNVVSFYGGGPMTTERTELSQAKAAHIF